MLHRLARVQDPYQLRAVQVALSQWISGTLTLKCRAPGGRVSLR